MAHMALGRASRSVKERSRKDLARACRHPSPMRGGCGSSAGHRLQPAAPRQKEHLTKKRAAPTSVAKPLALGGSNLKPMGPKRIAPPTVPRTTGPSDSGAVLLGDLLKVRHEVVGGIASQELVRDQGREGECIAASCGKLHDLPC